MNGNKIIMEDKTGQPRSDEDIEEAKQAVQSIMRGDILKVPPQLAVMLPTIRQSLEELLLFRKTLAKLKRPVEKDVFITNEDN